MASKKIFLILTILFSLVLFFLSLFPINSVYLWDEGVYLSTAENLFSDSPYYTEIDYRPPLLPFIIKIGSLVFDIDIISHIIVSLFFVLGIIGVYFLGSEVFNEKVGFLSSILFGLSPFLMHVSKQVMTDMPSASLLVISFLFYFKYVNSGKNVKLFLSGIFLGLAVLMRFTSLIIIPVILFALYLKEKRIKEVLKYCVFVLIPLLPHLIWAQFNQGFALLPFIRAQIIISGSGTILDKFYYFKALYFVGGLISVIGLVFYIMSLREFKKENFMRKDFVFILWFLFLFFYLTLSAHKELRYIIPLLPAVFILSSIGLLQFRRKIVSIFIIIVIVFVLISPYRSVGYFDGTLDSGEDILLARSGSLKEASIYLKSNFSNMTIYTHSLYPVIAYYSKMKTIISWPWDNKFYDVYSRNMNNDGLYIAFKDINKHPTPEWLDSNPKFRKLKEFDSVIIYSYKKDS